MSNLVPILGVNRHRLLIDGEGVTTLVAFHGCPLHCKYCLNPQSLSDDFDFPLYSCEQLYERVKVDELYFLATRGGITFGGGEPCLRSEFISRFRELCGKEWRITVETSLNVPRKHLEILLPVVALPLGVYLNALESRLKNIFSNLSRSIQPKTDLVADCIR